MKLIILGAGGHGRVVADAARAGGQFAEIAFVDDAHGGRVIDGVRCVGERELADLAPAEWRFVAAIGRNQLRQTAHGAMLARGYAAVTIVHPWSYVSPHAVIAPGCMVLAGAVVQTGARLGVGVIVNNHAIVEHDCVLEDFVHLASGAVLGGDVRIGSRTLVGSGAAIRKGTSIASDVVLGAGAVAAGDIPMPGVFVGVPARPMRA
jgi:sugar O-acyltransferase (sialic acid O-acetyltransferase NeuD family)